ncbi:hypothetical protein F4801DRAFT_562186 [Xylaria longipes]|nr:hypothetical protein F4801DRAFT_562186 [Xylaria longipes]
MPYTCLGHDVHDRPWQPHTAHIHALATQILRTLPTYRYSPIIRPAIASIALNPCHDNPRTAIAQQRFRPGPTAGCKPHTTAILSLRQHLAICILPPSRADGMSLAFDPPRRTRLGDSGWFGDVVHELQTQMRRRTVENGLAPRFFSSCEPTIYEPTTAPGVESGCWAQHTEETRENDRTRCSKRCEMRCYATGITRSVDRIVSGVTKHRGQLAFQTCCSRELWREIADTYTCARTH